MIDRISSETLSGFFGFFWILGFCFGAMFWFGAYYFLRFIFREIFAFIKYVSKGLGV